ncbi:MAG: gamma-glutamylcyclotransferase [Betaproteobacteria bacterium HGW-Betaproteobacteria-19]|nr:MAG: gamma-glutamylcyclotransferase [Betaproteobacteria bacterium HGW-Betaproteobacteria-19]
MSNPHRHCFTYGSLMCESIMFAVCGMPLAATPAVLEGFSRHPVRDEDYPGMVPASGSTVNGVLYHDVPPAALARLDTFEGSQYLRITVKVKLAEGGMLDADTYVFRPEHAALLLPGDWDYANFLRDGRQRFERRYVGYTRL